jgi:hypothetical protein
MHSFIFFLICISSAHCSFINTTLPPTILPPTTLPPTTPTTQSTSIPTTQSTTVLTTQSTTTPTTQSTTTPTTQSTTTPTTQSTTTPTTPSTTTYTSTSTTTYTSTSTSTSTTSFTSTITTGKKIKNENDTFYFKNGIVSCTNAEINDYGILNIHGIAKTFYARNRHRLQKDITEGNLNAIETACTTHIHDMSRFFENSTLNPDISTWDVSTVSNMKSMFENAINFSGDLSFWKTENVKDMENMFRSSIFNNSLSNWNVENVRIMNGMFEDSKFSQNISQWKTPWIKTLPVQFSNTIDKLNLPDWIFPNITELPSECRFNTLKLLDTNLYALLHDHYGHVDTCEFPKKLPPNWLVSTQQEKLQNYYPPLASNPTVGLLVKNLKNCSDKILLQHVDCPSGYRLIAGCNFLTNSHCSKIPSVQGQIVPFQFRYSYDATVKPLDDNILFSTFGWKITTITYSGRRRSSNETNIIIVSAGCNANLQPSLILIEQNMPIIITPINRPNCPLHVEEPSSTYLIVVAAISMLFFLFFCVVLIQQKDKPKISYERLPKSF